MMKASLWTMCGQPRRWSHYKRHYLERLAVLDGAVKIDGGKVHCFAKFRGFRVTAPAPFFTMLDKKKMYDAEAALDSNEAIVLDSV